jgi:membrane associated rhomboid family serine protease
MGLPRPGPALKALLVVIGVLGVLNALLYEYSSYGAAILKAIACIPDLVLAGRVWQVFTAGFVTDPTGLGHLFFTLLGLYFLSTDLERRWGSKRFLGFIFGSIVAGYTLAVVASLVPLAWGVLHPPIMFGAGAAITATAVAWSLQNAEAQVNLFFVLPLRGKTLFWITVGYCVVTVVFPHMAGSEGPIAPFGGVFVGLAFAGSRAGAPSPLRAFYLRMKLGLLRRKSGGAHLASYGLRPASGKRVPRSGSGPALHVVYGGLDDDGKPKDKRTLN